MHGADAVCPLVILPPLGVPAGATAGMAWALSAQRPVMQYEYPGHGLAPAAESITIASLGENVVRTLDRHDLARASLCGFGLGGMVALWVAANHPERTAHLCLACSSALPGNALRYHTRATDVRQRGLAALAPEIVTAWVTSPRAARDRPLMERLEALLSSTDPRSYAACCEALADLDLTDQLQRIQAPTLVLAASDDRGLPPEHSIRLAEAIDTSVFLEVPGAAHLPWLEQPTAVLDAIRQHVSGGIGVQSL